MNTREYFSQQGVEGLITFFQMFSRLLDQLPFSFYYSRKTPKGWFVDFVSDGITPLLGYKKEDIIGKLSFADLNTDKSFYGTLPTHSKAATIQFGLLCTMRTAHNTPKRLLDKGLLLFDEHGALAGATGILMDFTLQPGFDIFPYLSEHIPQKLESKTALSQLLGHSQATKAIIENILKVAHTQAHVLIQGESGTGKELAARAIHELSVFHHKPFIALNCGAINEHLMESELFGHVKGAFSGATATRQGYLDVVNNGTLFLDEVGEMPASMQVKLLRVLDGYGYTPVGSTKVKKTHFRLICATNRKLNPLIAAGVMRLDFYHRIKQLTITMPPLRERAGDIEILSNAFAERFYNENQLSLPPGRALIPPEIMESFITHNWPGNIRELHHAVIKYLLMGEVDIPSSPLAVNNERPFCNLPRTIAEHANDICRLPRSLNEYERIKLLNLLNANDWDIQKIADILGKSTRTVQRKIVKYGLK